MAESRDVRCGGTTYRIHRYDDQTVAILDAKGNLLAGWPETWALMARSLADPSESDWCKTIRQLRPWVAAH